MLTGCTFVLNLDDADPASFHPRVAVLEYVSDVDGHGEVGPFFSRSCRHSIATAITEEIEARSLDVVLSEAQPFFIAYWAISRAFSWLEILIRTLVKVSPLMEPPCRNFLLR